MALTTIGGVVLLLLLGSFVVTVMSSMGKAPLWPAVLLVTLAVLLGTVAR
jgi:hypothetical protein